MKLIVAAISFYNLLVIASSWPADGKIVNGTSAPDGAYPFMVSLRSTQKQNHFCGATIIGPNCILTAGHCVNRMQSASSIYAVVGTNTLLEGGTVYNLSSYIHHPGYTQNVIVLNDLAVLKTSQAIEFNEKVKPISLSPTVIGGEVPCTTIGWGKTEHDGSTIPNSLQELNTITITNKQCQRKVVIGYVSYEQLCTKPLTSQGACNGDSGGPLAIKTEGSEDLAQIGITSHVYGRCAGGKPDVYTRISKHLDWINEQCNSPEIIIA